MYTYRPVHTPFNSTHLMHQHHQSQPLPALLAEAPPRQVTRKSSVPWEPLSYISCSISFILYSVRAFLSLPLSMYLLWDTPRSNLNNFRPTSTPAFHPQPYMYTQGGGGGEYKTIPQVMNQVSQWSSHSTWWPRASRGQSVQLHSLTKQYTPLYESHALPLCSLHEFTLLTSWMWKCVLARGDRNVNFE